MGSYWDTMSQGVFTFAREAYSSMQPWDYPIFFLGIIAFIFLITNSATAAIVVMLITVALYGSNVFLEVPDLMMILYIFVLITLTSLFAFLIYKRRT